MAESGAGGRVPCDARGLYRPLADDSGWEVMASRVVLVVFHVMPGGPITPPRIIRRSGRGT